jgi:glycosyltransferase involved in cell wall biosynthesis
MNDSPNGQGRGIKVDLHVHSKHSVRPSQWVLQKLNCPESFTEPRVIYDRAKGRGMDLVTISDHNSIDGSLEIAHLDGVFISEEITTYFPEDRCKLHVLALGIDEEQHLEIQRLRENVYDLAAYLREEDIPHVVAHPLFDMNHLLSWEHIEKLLLLFTHFELNGAREQDQNECLRSLVSRLDRATIERWAEKHAIEPGQERPWEKSLVAGSDDHSSLNIARMYTYVRDVRDMDRFFHNLRLGLCEPMGAPSTPRTMAHNLYGIAYQFYRSKFHMGRFVTREPLLQYTDSILTGTAPREESFRDRLPSLLSLRKFVQRFSSKADSPVLDLVLNEARDMTQTHTELMRRLRDHPGSFDLEHDWFEMVNEMASRMSGHFADTVLESVAGARIFNIFQTLGSAGTIYSLLAPYFMAYTIFSKDRQFSRECQERFRRELDQEKPDRDFKMAVFTDTFTEMNGVATTLQQQLSIARERGMPFYILTCGQDCGRDGVVSFPSQGSFSLPEYPEQVLHYPPFLEMLDYCYSRRFTHILASTPGPVGMAALGVARILKLPIYGAYHTAVPQYVLERTRDKGMEEFIWKGIIWYYNQMDKVFAPSKAIARELVERGLSRDKVEVFPHGIDTTRFHPAKRNGFWNRYFRDSGEKIKLLYVGRISEEKNLDVLVRAFRDHLGRREDLKLIVVGDGPDLPRLRERLAGQNAVFTGPLTGEDLSQAYASSDIFVFPSCTDTFGNVVLEAQASGLPVVVTDKGGPQENMIHRETGYVVAGQDPRALADAVASLADDPGLLARMKEQARRYCRNRSFQAAFLDYWEFSKRSSHAP